MIKNLLDIVGLIHLKGMRIFPENSYVGVGYSARNIARDYRRTADDCDCASGSNCDCSQNGDCHCTSQNCDDC